VKTSLTAFAWYSILRVAFPGGRVAYLQILAAYAAGVALERRLRGRAGHLGVRVDTGGKLLVEQSYTEAAVKVDERKARRAEAKTSRRTARRARR
jgi:hypothetical protein